ncbi:hypothetical protein B0G57_105163 [Trinickia symbiotica]|uniref:DUF1795 domain-containing protein n=1 Tax=Trinickia symbiotica TaxID=863227 RepID=A0A2N7X1J4_9BURK|nr:DcrB-related protein [Trinickia symbiotica]PMS35432.1 DUF1795 domain-containing protein [Trinickia symbiotica]PPK45455.1 hypothetical protein B0G57_105163 [Trinickia symbiotica]
MDYAINEGTFTLPDTAIDRTVNAILVNLGPGGLSLVVSREPLQVEESEEAFIDRQLKAAARQVPSFKEVARRAVTVGVEKLPGTQIDLVLEQSGATLHQLQTVFRVGGDRMVVMTLTCAKPLDAEQIAFAQQMLDSFAPRSRAIG